MELDLAALYGICMGTVVPICVWAFNQWHTKWKGISKRLDELEKDLILVKNSMVTKDKLDSIIETRLSKLEADINDLKQDVRTDVSGIRADVQKILHMLVEHSKR
ncbi:hypothetical protein [Escherichia coli]|uniref:hypothetical protein n=1 Tax=Escherichia coli TaxID=562 RepID=UPI002F342C32|nr:hypothetical protein [Escherichia coli]